jgi:hypothetical protein
MSLDLILAALGAEERLNYRLSDLATERGKEHSRGILESSVSNFSGRTRRSNFVRKYY